MVASRGMSSVGPSTFSAAVGVSSDASKAAGDSDNDSGGVFSFIRTLAHAPQNQEVNRKHTKANFPACT